MKICFCWHHKLSVAIMNLNGEKINHDVIVEKKKILAEWCANRVSELEREDSIRI